MAIPGESYVLIVDDDPDVREALRDILECPGHRVQTARDGVEGLEAIAREPPACVLLDGPMPRMSGFEMLERLAADPKTREIPVVFMSGEMPGGGPLLMAAELAWSVDRARTVLQELSPFLDAFASQPEFDPGRRRELLRQHAPFTLSLLTGRGDETELLALLSEVGGGGARVAARLYASDRVPEDVIAALLRCSRN